MAELPPTVRELLAQRRGEQTALNRRYLNPQLARIVETLGFDRTWVSGEGAHLIDDGGRRYLDLVGGHGVFALGRNDPDVIEAIEAVMEAGTANLPQIGLSLLPGLLAEELVTRAPAGIDAMVTANSGTEAVEAAIKMARAATGRSRILFADHAFHGLTMGSLSINGNEEFREGFGRLLPDCEPVPFGDPGCLQAELAGEEIAAFVIEPVQGKGVNLPPSGYLEKAQGLCRETGTLFVCDEVQTGLGRTGRFFALEHWGLEPDMICVAKALSGGLVPIGGVLASRAVIDSLYDSMENGVRHSSTFGGNDLAAAAGLATLRVLDRDGLIERAERMGSLLLELTRPLVDRYEVVRDVRGLGLIWAIELGSPGGFTSRSLFNAMERGQAGLFAQMVTEPLFHDHRILCQVAGHHMNVIKVLPALVTSEQDIRRFASALEEVVSALGQTPSAAVRFGWNMARRAASSRRRGAV